MVRAAVSGAIDYSRADPLDNHWRIKHRLLVTEMQRREDQHMLENLHRHWCAYVAHGSLAEESFTKVKKSASDILDDLQNNVFPWRKDVKKDAESDSGNSKIDDAEQQLIERYKVWRGKLAGEGE
jgi:hypothetical protein